MNRRRLSVAALVCITTPIAAQTPPPSAGTLRLSDTERADVLNHNTETSVDDARAGLGGRPSSARQIHGEVGAAIGSNGLRSAYGAATIPLGNNAGASVYFEDSHYGTRR